MWEYMQGQYSQSSWKRIKNCSKRSGIQEVEKDQIQLTEVAGEWIIDTYHSRYIQSKGQWDSRKQKC